MTRLIAAFVLFALATGGLLALDEPPQVAAEVSQFRHDLPLLERLVGDGLIMAGENDPLRRADVCNRLAARFAEELRVAALNKEEARAADMGTHLEALLTRGVATNLGMAFTETPKDSPRSAELNRLAQQALEACEPAEAEMQKMPPAAAEVRGRILSQLQQGRAQVAGAAKGHWKSSHPSKHKKGKH